MFKDEIILVFTLMDFNKISRHYSGCITHETQITV